MLTAKPFSCRSCRGRPRRGGGCVSDRGRACSSPLTLARTPIGRQADSAAGRVFVFRAKRREADLFIPNSARRLQRLEQAVLKRDLQRLRKGRARDRHLHRFTPPVREHQQTAMRGNDDFNSISMPGTPMEFRQMSATSGAKRLQGRLLSPDSSPPVRCPRQRCALLTKLSH